MKESENNRKKTVSVIVPAYNAEKTIGYCIDSLIQQTYKPTEIIIINEITGKYAIA